MLRVCQQCGRGALHVVSRSHSNIATKRLQGINLQIQRIDGKRMRVCARCIRTHLKHPSVPQSLMHGHR